MYDKQSKQEWWVVQELLLTSLGWARAAAAVTGGKGIDPALM